jgi:hypothetical protein
VPPSVARACDEQPVIFPVATTGDISRLYHLTTPHKSPRSTAWEPSSRLHSGFCDHFFRSRIFGTHCHHASCTKKSTVLTWVLLFRERHAVAVMFQQSTARCSWKDGKRFRSRSLCIIDATLQSVLHMEDTLLYTFVDVRPRGFCFTGRATSLCSGLS